MFPNPIFTSLFLFVFFVQLQAQNNLNALIYETQKISTQSESMRMVWWIPVEYWEAAIQTSNANKSEDIAEIVRIFGQYTLVAVLDGEIDPFGKLTFRTASETKDSLTMLDPKGRRRKPLKGKSISYEAKTLLGVMQPSIAGTLGELGKHVQFFLFPGTTEQDKRLISPRQKGKFSIRLGKESFDWTLPIGSLLPQKKCPVDGQFHNGSWQYCPYHGAKLLDDTDSQ